MAESTEANFDQAENDLENDEVLSKVEKFLRDGCGCSRGIKGGQCSQQFSLEAVMANVNNCLELSHAELDLVVLANIQAFSIQYLKMVKLKICHGRKSQLVVSNQVMTNPCCGLAVIFCGFISLLIGHETT